MHHVPGFLLHTSVTQTLSGSVGDVLMRYNWHPAAGLGPICCAQEMFDKGITLTRLYRKFDIASIDTHRFLL
jgi:hypothetical protein